MERNFTSPTFLAAGALALPALVAILRWQNPGDSLLYAWPLLIVLPMFFLSFAGIVVPPIAFLLWCRQLMRGNAKIPRRTYVLFAVLAILDALYLYVAWPDGVAMQGMRYTRSICGINAGWIVALGALFFIFSKRPPSYRTSLFLHWLLFLWLACYAFPFLGEMP